MEELKVRLQAIELAVNGDYHLSPGFVEEFCYLQLRMIGELIALACLLAHGDIPATQKSTLQTSWDADKILKTLAGLHPNFFPIPVRREHQPPSESAPRGSIRLHEVTEEYLTKEEILSFIGKVGNKLHRGSLKKVLRNQLTVQMNFPEITSWHDKIVRLLNEHRIMLADSKSMYYCALMEPSMNNQVMVAFAEAPLPIFADPDK
ncbi:hypothetical protein ABIC65_003327 [Sphingomonas trueperi]|uniref:hypothetical protein n=1 Tax=Sphingomonas trueperi TaxID=53317 RepID=UPI0033934EBD